MGGQIAPVDGQGLLGQLALALADLAVAGRQPLGLP
jgi:hypothetical protein